MDDQSGIGNLFQILIIVMFSLKTVNILQTMNNLNKPDIFFIDWVLFIFRKINISMSIRKNVGKVFGDQ